MIDNFLSQGQISTTAIRTLIGKDLQAGTHLLKHAMKVFFNETIEYEIMNEELERFFKKII